MPLRPFLLAALLTLAACAPPARELAAQQCAAQGLVAGTPAYQQCFNHAALSILSARVGAAPSFGPPLPPAPADSGDPLTVCQPIGPTLMCN